MPRSAASHAPSAVAVPFAQKDKDARWTKKNDASFFGYKNHLGVDKAHKLIRKWDATDAAVHDSQKLDDVLDARCRLRRA